MSCLRQTLKSLSVQTFWCSPICFQGPSLTTGYCRYQHLLSTNMAPQPITLSSLSYISPQTLSAQILDPSCKVTVVDVRDNDYLGGHIKGSVHAPIDQLDARMPELLRTLKDQDRVVFHCMLSQQRGPKAALAYTRAKAVAEAKAKSAKDKTQAVTDGEDEGDRTGKVPEQEICVLEGGFGTWQSRYGQDKALTEGYVKELWESVFS